MKIKEIPDHNLRITLPGGRTMLFLGKADDLWQDDESYPNKQTVYHTGNMRHWTHNGEVVSEDVILAILNGAEKIEELND